MKLVIIGGVAGGATAAGRYRRLDRDAEILILDKGDYISFGNCGLPYYIGGTVEKETALLSATPASMKKDYDIEVRIRNEVKKIDRESKILQVVELDTGRTYEESYDKLILATGSTPLRPPIPGIESDSIFVLWTIPDANEILKYMEENKVSSAAIIGGGAIGLEVAENLQKRGLDVTILEMGDQVLGSLDQDMAQHLHTHLKEKGIHLILEDGVNAFANENGQTQILTESGVKLTVDMVILSIGIRPNNSLAVEAGLKVGERGGIVVSCGMQTSDPDIYAAGNVIEVEDFVLKTKTMSPLAGPANKEGRIAANVLAGLDDCYTGAQGTSAVRIFEMDACSTGLNEKNLIQQGMIKGKDFETIKIQAHNHAGYYPDPRILHIKAVFQRKTGKLLGAQVVGGPGSDKRIDIFSTIIRYGGCVQDLKHLEFAYAPPFSTAKDPLNIIGYLAEKLFDQA